ncbi:MAG: C_GCAxxG_C_C family protein [Candidatus Aminicenantes bacterium]|jgi:C_GCAxxG_C_C family probable redox protein|nr:C_GCAxxG_C_C family protein [Candidatus Aminicenantes bacterium]
MKQTKRDSISSRRQPNKKLSKNQRSPKAIKARELFQKGFSCSQAVFVPYAVEVGLSEEMALKLSQVLGGGISHMGLICGVVSGAWLALSLNFGRCRAEDRKAKELTYSLAQKFCERFIRLHGSINCSDLIGCSLKTPQGLALANEKRLFQKYCRAFVEDACFLLDELIKEGREKQKTSVA